MSLGQIVIFFAIMVVYVFALVMSSLYLTLDCKRRLPDDLERLCFGVTFLLGAFFCLVSIDLIYRMFL
jgi:hypothetical protein